MMQMMNRQMVNRRGALCALALSFGLGMVTSGLGQSLTWLGTYDGYAEAHGVSDDGTVVVGWAGVTATHIAFRWTSNTGWQDIGSPTGSDTEAWGLSADGQASAGAASAVGG
jgi:probable HAF family extracellular repeat protein